MPPNTRDTIDFRLMIATHELGHAVTWKAAGFHVASIRLTGRGFNTAGEVSLDRPTCKTEDEARAYVVGILAGQEAGNRWCEMTGSLRSDHARGCRWDLQSFRRNRKHFQLTNIPERVLRAEARAQVRAQWSHIARLAPKLVHRSSLSL